MKKRFFSLAYSVLILASLSFSFPEPARAFNMTIAPAKKVLEVERGDVIDYRISFRNDAETFQYKAQVVDFVYNSSGVRNFIEAEDLANASQALSNWVTLSPENFQAEKGKENSVSVTLRVPEDAQYGDHFAVVLVEKYISPDEAGTTVSVGGSIASVLAVKVLGGEVLRSGGLVSYDIETQQRARNTVNFLIKFNNTGNQFFDVLAEIEILENETDAQPVKVITRDFTIFPNVVRDLKIPLGDLGDDYGEKGYVARLRIYEFDKGEKVKIMAEQSKIFQYYVPISSASEVQVIEKEVIVPSSNLDLIKELGLYAFGFLLVLIILIKALFFSKKSEVTSTKKR